MGENMGESMDSVYREYLVAGTTAAYSGGTTRATVDEGFFRPLVDTAIRVLRNQEAKTFAPMVPGSTRIASFPIGESYWAIVHPDVEHDIRTVATATSGWTWGTDFIPVEQYSNHAGVMESEIGKYRNVRFITTTNAKVWSGAGASGTTTYKNDGSNFDVYACLIFGRDAYAVIPLMRGSGRTIIQRAGGNTDPLEQRNTVGWKAAGCALITNDNWMYRIEHCITL
jgi:N4-gp56 family major capsid protein